ncbi:unnamed protein product [Ceratitis capitata]|uniref:(Mediterranean fruit fly) hypothetical protein n=1 Tax=Ceratitis capitata TaxID=7213 RepID=A0A811UG90_CERCA|nr:unnamed protein product [Ceratitis capitata]
MSVITTDNGNIIQKPDSNEMVDCLPLHVTHRVVNAKVARQQLDDSVGDGDDDDSGGTGGKNQKHREIRKNEIRSQWLAAAAASAMSKAEVVTVLCGRKK